MRHMRHYHVHLMVFLAVNCAVLLTANATNVLIKVTMKKKLGVRSRPLSYGRNLINIRAH